jgi:hypothetical protein
MALAFLGLPGFCKGTPEEEGKLCMQDKLI